MPNFRTEQPAISKATSLKRGYLHIFPGEPEEPERVRKTIKPVAGPTDRKPLLKSSSLKICMAGRQPQHTAHSTQKHRAQWVLLWANIAYT